VVDKLGKAHDGRKEIILKPDPLRKPDLETEQAFSVMEMAGDPVKALLFLGSGSTDLVPKGTTSEQAGSSPPPRILEEDRGGGKPVPSFSSSCSSSSGREYLLEPPPFLEANAHCHWCPSPALPILGAQ